MEKENFADQIASILNTPLHFDPENDNADSTKAIVNYENVKENNEHLPIQSQIRKQNIDLLADIDERYVGKKASRKNLNSHEESPRDESSSENDQEEDSDNENGGEEEASEEVSGEEASEEEASEEEASEEEASEEENFSTDEDSKESHSANDYVGDSDQVKEQINLNTLKDDISQQVKKGRCVINQMTIWESLLEIRIQIQKCLTAANKMPQFEKYKEIKNESGQEFSKSVQQAKNLITVLLDKFLYLQNLLWKKCPEVKKLGSKKIDKLVDDDHDDEISSDTEEELNEVEEETEEEPPKKKMKLTDFEKDIQYKHDLFKGYRNSVIQKWHDKTRLPIMKNNTNSHSIITHIEHTLADKAKLIKRSQLKRTEYAIIGEESVGGNEVTPNQSHQQEYNSEIFDDNDFYHQLLRELIEVKSAALTDPVQLGRQWIQLQNLRSKMKRKIDTRATKGRKIRYAVHTKLVNFMAPIYNNLWTDEAKTELFGSLFGNNKTLVS